MVLKCGGWFLWGSGDIQIYDNSLTRFYRTLLSRVSLEVIGKMPTHSLTSSPLTFPFLRCPRRVRARHGCATTVVFVKKLKGVAEIVAVIAVETARAIIDGKLRAQSDVEAVAMQQIADISNCVRAYRKDARFVRGIAHELVTGFLDTLPAQINCVAAALIIRFNQERLGFSFASIMVLAPHKCFRPVAIVSKRKVIDHRRRRSMPFQVGLERFGTFDVTVGKLQR